MPTTDSTLQSTLEYRPKARGYTILLSFEVRQGIRINLNYITESQSLPRMRPISFFPILLPSTIFGKSHAPILPPNPFIKTDRVSSLFRGALAARIHHNPNTTLASKAHLLVSKLANCSWRKDLSHTSHIFASPFSFSDGVAPRTRLCNLPDCSLAAQVFSRPIYWSKVI